MRASGVRRAAVVGSVQRVLFVQLAESGSMVLADPAMREVAARARAIPFCVTFARNQPSLSLTRTVPTENVFALRSDSFYTLVVDAVRLLSWVRRKRIDVVVDFELFSRLTAVMCLLTGVRTRVGFHRFNGDGLYRGDLYSHPVAFNSRLHMAENYLLLAEGLVGGTAPPAPRVSVASLRPLLPLRSIDVDAQRVVREKLFARGVAGGLRLVLINANASAMLPQRRWPQAHFVEVIDEVLGAFDDVQVLLIGADEDGACASAIEAIVNDRRCMNIAGLFRLEDLPALFSLAAVMVSNDSGPAHFAAVTELPVIVLFGPETPQLFRPLGNATVITAGLACSPCVNVGNQRRSLCTDNQCMKRIPVSQVLGALRVALESPAESLAVVDVASGREAVEA
jgi:ADP-heptose:LPS heptosyltransferase